MFIPKNSSNLQVGVTNEIVSSHIRSLMVSHLFDVASSDQHTVKPWFAGKLDFSPIVKDLPEKNFQLIGGRLDYIGGRTVAVVVYQYQKHIINVFEWTVNDNQYQTRIVEHDKGFNIIGDHSGEINFWVVSDLNTEELSQLVDPLK
jgi:anti-sigma factor RsiW